ncbi:MAG: hypothetical protein HRU40_12550, partial [Saprospiraceae bacterium]|nr:hypothetical protein [Saprospiraceae bacterium]
LRFLNYQLINPFRYLKQRTKDEKIIIISEAHHKPQHRVFTRKLLKTLYENGFRYLGLETITPSYGDSTQFLMDTQLNHRKYPLNSPITGFYSREPQMANLIREAIQLGFEIFGYEKMIKGKDRDLQQAINIQKFMKKQPNGKMVIHCGWYHAIESDFPKRKKDNYMAYHLKKITGINPLTIYQDALSEKEKIVESPFYQMIDSKKIGMLINDKKEIFNGHQNQKHFDIFIYHPRTQYLNNRPHWLFEIHGNKFVEVETDRINIEQYPIIVKAILNGENYTAAPIDQVELKSKEDLTPLVLKPGDYQIVITDKNRNEIRYFKKVK